MAPGPGLPGPNHLVEGEMTDPSREVPMRAQSGDWTLEHAGRVMSLVRARLMDAMVGREQAVDLVLVALFADGHVLLEDYPGSGKTTLAKALGESLDEQGCPLPPFRRIQFTPDLLPSDVTGVMVFDPDTNRFHFRRGPLFAHVVLVDEINRASPKVQAAMLEAMAEKQVTVDDRTRPLDHLFFVIATQNPLDLAGTYPLPLPQLDRFLFKIRMEHIDRASELQVLATWRKRLERPEPDLPKVTRDQILVARRVIRDQVAVSPLVQECLVDSARAVRESGHVRQGLSTRSLVLAIPALQARAALAGRDYVSSDDLDHLAGPLFAHRLDLVPGAPDPAAVLSRAMAGPLDTLASHTRLG